MIYVASPYTDESEEVMQQRYDQTTKFCSETIRYEPNSFIFSSICYWHPIASIYGLPRSSDYWLSWNVAMLKISESMWILMLEGYEKSKGVRIEKAVADALNIDVFWKDPRKYERLQQEEDKECMKS